MTINTTVNPIVMNPERIRNLGEVEIILSRINTYEQKTGKNVGVILLQNLQLGGVSVIIPEEKALKKLREPVSDSTSEYGIVFWKHSYFENLINLYSSGEGILSSYEEVEALFKEDILYRN